MLPGAGAGPGPEVGHFDDETAVTDLGGGRWAARLHREWSIGANANGGYALVPVLRALRAVAGHPDPISVTTHFLRPAEGGVDAEVRTQLVRAGRTVSSASGSLVQDARQRLAVLAAFGDLSSAVGAGPELALDPPDLPPPEECSDRAGLEQGVDLPILSRVDVRIRPEHAVAGRSDRAVVEGWIRLADGTPPSSLALVLFADAFPPSLYPLAGRVGWVPTVELTVHVRRRPGPGWARARLECDDLHGGRMVESGTLWDASGAVVARSRQIGLLLGG